MLKKQLLGRIWAVWVLFTCATVCSALVRTPPPQQVPVVLLSDLHFDPFFDAAKFQQLRSAPAAQWARILNAPPSATQAKDFDALQKSCRARGVDSSWDLLHASLEAAHKQEPAPLFVTVSGDLLVHKFDCRMKTLAPKATPEELSAFAQKTIEFLALQLEQTFPGVAVYLALGNNDSGCSDYHQTLGSEFSRRVEQSFNGAIFNRPHDQSLLPDYDPQEDYSVDLPSPMHRGRIIVLQNIFESPEYGDCSGKKSTDSAAAQVAWLRTQLSAARSDHESVWVMAHIPPGVDAYASFHKYIATPEKLCEPAKTTPMLASEELANTLADFSDVVKLAIFAHTHMDEFKVLRNAAGNTVPAKLVPSISPVNGNRPAFTVAQVSTQTATLQDYTVFAAKDAAAQTWGSEYRYSEVYKMPDYSAESVAKLGSALAADRTGEEQASVAYQHWFLPGDSGAYAAGLKKIWPSYACGVAEDGGPAFQRCMCPVSGAQQGTATTTQKPD